MDPVVEILALCLAGVAPLAGTLAVLLLHAVRDRDAWRERAERAEAEVERARTALRAGLEKVVADMRASAR